MSKVKHQVLARKYRPQTFGEVIGQEPTVTTLKNAIKFKRLAHAYLFSGPRGTGKTTMARVFAKALNCTAPTAEREPCNQCSSCKEITSGTSLDVLEIDGASHRGIDDIRQINETVGYSTSTGGYKIYIIDEVHMLTKEAFNALLKTLEEPPANVKFFFATTEPHKVLPTIISRCQRFNLNRITVEHIVNKLKGILDDLGQSADEEALRTIAQRAEGGLRDAESILDQLLSFNDGQLTSETVSSALGIVSKDSLFQIDRAGKEGSLSSAFDIAGEIFVQGKDIPHFVEMLIEHFRNILLIRLSGKDAVFLTLSSNERERYAIAAEMYSTEQCMHLIEYLIKSHAEIKQMPSGRIALEAILLYILRSHKRIPIEVLVRRLAELEQAASSGGSVVAPAITAAPAMASAAAIAKTVVEAIPAAPPVAVVAAPPIASIKQATPVPAPVQKMPEPIVSSMTIDPSPEEHEIVKPLPKPAPKPKEPKKREEAPSPPQKRIAAVETVIKKPVIMDISPEKPQSHYDTVLQFASVELEGRVQKSPTKKIS